MVISRRQQVENFDREFRRAARRFEAAATQAIQDKAEAVRLTELRDAVASGSVARVLAIADELKLSDLMEAREMDRIFRETYETGGRLGLVALGASAPQTAGFRLLDPRSVDFLQRHNAQFVREIDEATRSGITETIRRSFAQGGNATTQARVIKDSIGLTEKQSLAVDNFRAQLEGRRVSGFGQSPRNRRLSAAERARALRQIERGHLNQQQIDRLVEQYRARLVRLRAQTIARTETIRALNEGQEEMWRQAQQEGYLDTQTLRRWWTTAGDSRVRDTHRMIPGMNPDGVRFNEPFETPGGPTMSPPPYWSPFNCRCRVVLSARRRGQNTPR